MPIAPRARVTMVKAHSQAINHSNGDACRTGVLKVESSQTDSKTGLSKGKSGLPEGKLGLSDGISRITMGNSAISKPIHPIRVLI